MAGFSVDVVTSNPSSLAASSRSVERVRATTLADAPRAVSEACDGGGYRCLFPTSDAVQRALGLAGVEIIDKRELYRLAASIDVPVPPTRFFDDAAALRHAADDRAYPRVLKPAIGKPAMRASSPADTERFLRRVDGRTLLLAQPILEGQVRAVAGVVRDGHFVALVHQIAQRAWPSASGITCAAMTVDPDPVLETWAEGLLVGYDGIFQAQFLSGALIDLNLRPYGSISLAVQAGANLPSLAADGGGESSLLRARAGVRYRWLEGDMRLLRATMRHRPRELPAAMWRARPRPGTAHGDPWTLRDLGPARARLRQRGNRPWAR
jgi:hypothetical protein